MDILKTWKKNHIEFNNFILLLGLVSPEPWIVITNIDWSDAQITLKENFLKPSAQYPAVWEGVVVARE